MKVVLLNLLIFVFFSLGHAQSDTEVKEDPKVFKTTTEQGMSKFERLEYFDTYLKTISDTMKSLEIKIDENSKKIKSLDENFQKFKLENELAKNKKVPEVIIESKKSISKSTSNGIESEKNLTANDEIAKIKQDIELLKVKDLGKLRSQINNLADTLEAVQATLRSK